MKENTYGSNIINNANDANILFKSLGKPFITKGTSHQSFQNNYKVQCSIWIKWLGSLDRLFGV